MSNFWNSQKRPSENEDVDLQERQKAFVPRRYKVIFHNDDYTTREFVIDALVRFFQKSEGEATQLMLTVHYKGQAVVASYEKEIAETKVDQVLEFAKDNGMPLLVTCEPG